MESIAIQPQAISLPAFRKVWELEEADVKNFLAGNHAQSTAYRSDKLIEKTGVSKNVLLAGLSLIPGGSTASLLAQLAVGAPDLLRGRNLEAAALATRRLLRLEGQPLHQVDWDLSEEVGENLDSWLLPRIRQRLETLTSLESASAGNEEVKSRRIMYTEALDELSKTSLQLRGHLEDLMRGWCETHRGHEALEINAKARLEQELEAIHIGVQALLWDQASADAKRSVVENEYKSLKCRHTRLLQRCTHLAIAGGLYCPNHTCADSGCKAERTADSRYCSAHSAATRRDADLFAQLSKSNYSLLEADDRALAAAAAAAAAARQPADASPNVGSSKHWNFAVGMVIILLGVLMVLSVPILSNASRNAADSENLDRT